MPVTNQQIVSRLSGGGGNSNPHASLGGGQSSSAPLSNATGTFTSNASIGDTQVFDSGHGGMDGDRDGEFLLFESAGNLEVARIVEYRASDGRMLLDRQLVNAVTIGDTWRSFLVNDQFDAVDATESSLGDIEYRGFYWINNGTSTLQNFVGYIVPLDPGDAEFALLMRDDSTALQTIANESTAPSLVPATIGTDDAKWSAPRDFTQAEFEQPTRDAPGGIEFTLGATARRGYWIRRTIPPNARRRNAAYVLVVGEGRDSGSGGALRRNAVVIAFDTAGFTPQISVTHDRSVREGGGARFTATVRAAETGNVVPDVDVGWELTGPGTLFTDEIPITDENGQNSAVYAAPDAEPAIVDSFLTPGALPSGYSLRRDTADYDGSYVSSIGAMVDAAASAARWTYNPDTLTLRGLLNEPARTNLARDSEVPKDTTADYGDTPATVTPGYTGKPLLGVNVSRVQSTLHAIGADVGTLPFATLSGSTQDRVFVGSSYIGDNGSVGTSLEIRMREEGGVAANAFFVSNESRAIPANVGRTEAFGAIVEDDRTQITFMSGRAEQTGDYDFVQGFMQIEEAFSGEDQAASSWIRTTTAAQTRARDVLIRTGLPSSVYDITIVRDGVADEVLSGVLIDGTYVVPTSVYPLRSITFTPANAGEQITVEATV